LTGKVDVPLSYRLKQLGSMRIQEVKDKVFTKIRYWSEQIVVITDKGNQH